MSESTKEPTSRFQLHATQNHTQHQITFSGTLKHIPSRLIYQTVSSLTDLSLKARILRHGPKREQRSLEPLRTKVGVRETSRLDIWICDLYTSFILCIGMSLASFLQVDRNTAYAMHARSLICNAASDFASASLIDPGAALTMMRCCTTSRIANFCVSD